MALPVGNWSLQPRNISRLMCNNFAKDHNMIKCIIYDSIRFHDKVYECQYSDWQGKNELRSSIVSHQKYVKMLMLCSYRNWVGHSKMDYCLRSLESLLWKIRCNLSTYIWDRIKGKNVTTLRDNLYESCLLYFGIWQLYCCNLPTDSSFAKLDIFGVLRT